MAHLDQAKATSVQRGPNPAEPYKFNMLPAGGGWWDVGRWSCGSWGGGRLGDGRWDGKRCTARYSNKHKI